MIYKKDQPVFAGGSGCACSAVVTYHFLNRMRNKEIKRLLIVATGALLSPLSYQQKEHTLHCTCSSYRNELRSVKTEWKSFLGICCWWWYLCYWSVDA